MIEQAKFTYSPMEQSFKKQTKKKNCCFKVPKAFL